MFGPDWSATVGGTPSIEEHLSSLLWRRHYWPEVKPAPPLTVRVLRSVRGSDRDLTAGELVTMPAQDARMLIGIEAAELVEQAEPEPTRQSVRHRGARRRPAARPAAAPQTTAGEARAAGIDVPDAVADSEPWPT